MDVNKEEEPVEAKVEAKLVNETLNKTVDVDKMNNTRNIHERSTTFDINDRGIYVFHFIFLCQPIKIKNNWAVLR